MNIEDPTVFNPAGPGARQIEGIWWLMFALAIAVYIVVAAFIVVAVVRKPGEERTTRDNAFIWLGGIAMPVAILAVLATLTVHSATALDKPSGGSPLRVAISGRQWWWQVVYPHQAIVTANELHIPAGRTVRLLLDSHDVIHSFWVPQLSGKIDMIPGRMNHLVLRAERPGVYRAQCAEYCGAQHAWMALYVVAHEPVDYERWLEREARAAQEPPGEVERRGAALFESAGCASCHTVRGTPAGGRLGPDLTHVASRLALGAGVIGMSRGALAGWISNSQALKPGNLMPPMVLATDELHAVTAYVAALK